MTLTVIMAQLNFTVGALATNAQQMLDCLSSNTADLWLFPELALCGYLPEDLLLRPDFLQANWQQLQWLMQIMPPDKIAIIGYPELNNHKVYNSAAVIRRGQLIANHRKQLLPNYGVFDEQRYFTAGDQATVFSIKNLCLGVTICEDLWFSQPARLAKQAGAQLLCHINASPFFVDKPKRRLAVLRKRIAETHLPILSVHHCGAQDDLVFDGGTIALSAKGEISAQAPFATATLVNLQVALPQIVAHDHYATPIPEAQLYQVLVLALRDYVHKNGFTQVILGFSGGIDSALTLAIAVDALGRDHVLPVLLPARYTSTLSLTLAHEQLAMMQLASQEISIESAFSASLTSLGYVAEAPPNDLMAQNLQARCRGLLLMAMANRDHRLLLSTTNKSEAAVGYGTLYGDLCGAYAVLKDVYKTLVLRLAHYRNQQNLVIPKGIIDRPPSAELAPNQQDTDSLPPYVELDAILQRYIEQQESREQIIAAGFDAATVNRVIRLVQMNEYKRRQTPLGPKVTECAFTRERRYPITAHYA